MYVYARARLYGVNRTRLTELCRRTTSPFPHEDALRAWYKTLYETRAYARSHNNTMSRFPPRSTCPLRRRMQIHQSVHACIKERESEREGERCCRCLAHGRLYFSVADPTEITAYSRSLSYNVPHIACTLCSLSLSLSPRTHIAVCRIVAMCNTRTRAHVVILLRVARYP